METFYSKLKKKYKLGLFNFVIKIFNLLYKKIRFNIILDKNLILPHDKIKNKKIKYKFYSKEILARKIIFKENQTKKLNFLDVGGDDGELTYLLKYYKNFELNSEYKMDLQKFNKKYDYYFQDIINPNSSTSSTKNKNFILGDICSKNFIEENLEFTEYFDVIYSNNVFEHLKKPWIACSNINKLLKVNGICITIVPFSQRYHESPVDCFRYTHEGIRYLFEDEMEIEIIASGYDIDGRRNNWNGTGKYNDYVIEDNFGAWRENWTTVFIFKKIKSLQ